MFHDQTDGSIDTHRTNGVSHLARYDLTVDGRTDIEIVLDEVKAMRADFAKIQETLSTIQQVIEPAIADLKKSPIGKMLGI